MPFDVDLTEEKDSSLDLDPTSHPSEADESSEPEAAADVGDAEEVVRICKRCMVAKSGDCSFCKECGDRLVPIRSTGDSYAGQVVGGRYKLVDKLGSGGMGEVYLGLNESLGQRVAVKFLAEKYAANEQVIMRFLNEARSYCKVSHPNAVTLLDYGQHDDGALYLITEYVEGLSLTEAVDEHGPLSPEKALSVTEQCCEVLVAAHEQGVIHRDLKPDNIMLMPMQRGEYAVKVLDFGIAKIVDDERASLTKTGSVFGTPEFMSPEQAKGETADPRSDVYAMGIILYYAATGKLPFSGESQFEVLEQQIKEEPDPPSEVEGVAVPEELESVALRCLRKEREDRFESAEALLDAIDDVERRLDPEAAESGEHAASSSDSGEQRTIELTSVAEETGNDSQTRGYPAGSSGVDARASTASARPTGAVPRGERDADDSSPDGASESEQPRTVGAFDDERPDSSDALPLRRSRSSGVPWAGVGAAILLTAGVVAWNVSGGEQASSSAEGAAAESSEETAREGDRAAVAPDSPSQDVEGPVERAKEALQAGEIGKAESRLEVARRRAQKIDEERADELVRSVATRLKRIEANQQALAQASENGRCARAADIGDDLEQLAPGRSDWIETKIESCSTAESERAGAEAASDGSTEAGEGRGEASADGAGDDESSGDNGDEGDGAERASNDGDETDGASSEGGRAGSENAGEATGRAEGRAGGAPADPEPAEHGGGDDSSDEADEPKTEKSGAGADDRKSSDSDASEREREGGADETEGDEPSGADDGASDRAPEREGDQADASESEGGDGEEIPEGMSLPPDRL